MGGHSCPSDREGKMPVPTRGLRAPSPMPRGVPQRLLMPSLKAPPGTPPLSQDLLNLATSSASLRRCNCSLSTQSAPVWEAAPSSVPVCFALAMSYGV